VQSLPRELAVTHCQKTEARQPHAGARTGLSQSTISRIWRAFGLKPHCTESFQLSTDPLLIDKVRDIVGLYLDPPHHALVLCVDEKSQIQAQPYTACAVHAGRTTGATHA
jgi:hypothetical protein